MALNYIQAIGQGFPAVGCYATGSGANYASIVWVSGDPVPSQETLDAYISANPQRTGVELTKYEFRKLFTFNERVAIDNAPNNTAIPANYRAILFTMFKDLDLSGIIQLSNPDVASGVGLLESLGLIAAGRGDQILANQSPA